MLIAEVLQHYGADTSHVREHGWRALACPFHDDRHASARVNLELGGFACMAGHCGVKGDAFKIIALREGLDRDGAKRWAQEVLGASGFDVPQSAPKPRGKSRWRTSLFGEPRD